MMKRSKIENSNNIAAIGYDEPTLTLEIQFHNGKIYQYWPITRSGYDEFIKAESKGKFFYTHIRNNKGIQYRKLDELQSKG